MDQHQAAETVVRIVGGVLPAGSDLSLDTPLRDYGLASLAVTRLTVELQAELGVRVGTDWLAGGADTRWLIERVTGLLAEADTPAVRPTPAPSQPDQANRHEPFPLTPVQQAYLVGRDPDLAADPVGCRHYREFAVPALDGERMAAAWRRTVAHHDMLRMELDELGRQLIAPRPADDAVPVHRLTDVDPAEFEQHLLAVRRRLTAPESDGPPHRVEVSLGPGDSGVVHLDIDGMLTDGHGLAVLLEDWWQCYRDPRYEPAEAAVTVREAVLALHARRRGPEHRADLEYWLERLAGRTDAPPAAAAGSPAECPGGHPRRSLAAALTPAQWSALRTRAAALGVSPTALVLAAFVEVMTAPAPGRPFALVLTTSDRVRLPHGTDRLVGPFTSTAVLPVVPEPEYSFDEWAQALHRELWRDLEHGGACGVEVLRELRAREHGAEPPALPVVFTSLLDTGTGGTDGLTRHLLHATSRTSGIGLDHQMWEADGALHYRWDVADGLLAPGAADTLFTGLGNTLRELAAPGTDDHELRPLNQLQQAYYVARAQGRTPWDGCQVYHAFEVDELDTGRLEDAWHALTERYECLRSHVTRGGELQVRRTAGPRRRIPVIDLSTATPQEESAALDALRDAMAGTAFPLGHWPQSDLRVTRHEHGGATVHCAIDLTIADGRSLHLMLRELMREYAAPTAPAHPAPAGDPPPVPTPEERAACAAYWRERFTGMPAGPVLRAGADRRRSRRSGVLTGWREVRATAERRGLSPDAVLLAVLTEAVATRTEGDFTVPAVRWLPGDEQRRPGEYTGLSWITHGPAGLPLAERAAAHQTQFDRDDASGAAADGLAALRRVVMKERAGRAFALPVVHTGLLELTEHAPPPGVRLGRWMTYTPDVSLDAICVEQGDELHYHWDAVPADFADGDLEAMFAAYRRLLGGLGAALAGGPARGTGPVIRGAGQAERDLVLYRWNDTAVPLPDERPVHLFFEDRARENPDAVALVHSGGTVRYRDLDRTANGIARRLRALGAGPDQVVAVSVRRGPAMIAAVLGVLKAGAAYLPIEPSAPVDRAAAMLADAGARLLLTTSDTERGPAPAGITVAEIDRGIVPCDTPPPPTADADSIAYVIFTSGSTGRPKGVTVAHRSVRNLLHWCWRTFSFGPGDLGLMVTSLGFDLSVFDIFGLLGSGAALYLADERQQKDPELLLDLLLEQPITFWNSAPTTLAQLMPLLTDRAAGRPGADDLRLVFLSGDYTPLSLPDELRAVFRRAELVSLGGATEATVWSNYHRVDAVDPAWRSIPYGRPIDNSRYYILDESLEPCPVGVEGELFIAGNCLAVGYHNRPELTAERFLADPFVAESSQRMYRTGDRAAFGPDGVITFLGRADTQVKIRGHRVELGEIEHRLRSHPGVKEAVIQVRTDSAGDQKVVGYLIPDGAAPSVPELRGYAARALPDYMVPNHLIFLTALPATANGKLDRAALPWPPPAQAEQGATPAGAGQGTTPADAAAPADAAVRADAARLTEEITAIVTGLLDGQPIDPDQDLWDQGATSFTVVRISQALQKRHRVRIPVSVLLDSPTVAGIARALAGQPTGQPTGQLAVPAQPLAVPATDAPSATDADSAVEASSAADARPAAPEPVDLLSPEQQAAFKAARWNLRADTPAEPALPLPIPEDSPGWFTARATRRTFTRGPLPVAALAALLARLRVSTVDGRERRAYPSAGDTYAVQTYLHVRPGGVEQLAAGIHYYDPYGHRLRLVNPEPAVDRSAHFFYNRPVFDHAAFEIYLIGQTRGIEPLYGPDAERFLLLEAGYLGQNLMAAQQETGVGLCPIGSLAFDAVRAELRLDEGHRFLHAFLGGGLADRMPDPEGRPARLPAHLQKSDQHQTDSDRVDPHRADPRSGAAVIGLAGSYPDAATPDELWRNLVAGRRSIGVPPAARAAETGAIPGGYLADIDGFDRAFFRLSPAEARSLDPQLRLLLQSVLQCLEDAGHTPESLRRAAPRTGVFIATMWNDHQHVGAREWERTGRAEVSGVASDLPNRISHAFGFRGPSLAVNTSCSSSLTALHLAVESLERGECDAAVVGAANLIAHPYHTAVLDGFGLVVQHGVRGAFDAAASGWSPGEGVGALLLRRADDARRDGDHVHGVVEGTWVDFAGNSDQFGAPDVSAMYDSMARVLRRAGVAADDISYVECAATGAALADAAEIEALGRLFQDRAEDPVPVGTLKAGIGHLEAASGLAQLTKALLQLRHRRIAPTPVADRLSPLIDWDGIPLLLADRARDWRESSGAPLRTLVNAVGATGSLAHAVLRSATADDLRPAGQAASDGPLLAVLSGRSKDELRSAAEQLAEYLVAADPDPADLAFTLQTGRTPHTHRLAAACADLASLRAELAAYLTGRPPVPPADEAAVRWLAGEDVDWAARWSRPARRIPLPARRFPAARLQPGREQPAPDAVAAQDHPADEETARRLVEVFAEVSGLPADRLDPRTPLEELGLTSYLVARLTARLRDDFGTVPTTLFFEHRDLAGIARAVARRSAVQPAVAAPPDPRPEAPRDTGVAVIGLAGRYPGSPTPDALWEHLTAGRDLVTALPADRRRGRAGEELMWGGFLDHVDRFDPLLFGIAPKDADLMDPQERLLLEVVWETLEDAGYPRERLRRAHDRMVGVFVGSMHNEYPYFGVERSLAGRPVATGGTPAGIANRVSYALDAHGPSLTVDTMCSSSLTAVHLAVRSLQAGECRLALAAGVNLSLHPNKYLQQRDLGMTSTDHRCRGFGAGGDGFVPGEGVGAVLLKPLAAARADGDRILGVIKGTAVNHGGRTNGYTVPDPAAQGRVVAEALRVAGVAAQTVGYLEAHGTGTALGDPVEIAGLCAGYGELPAGSVALGTVKSNIGHLEAAAGIAGLTKVLLQLRHRRLVPSLHTEELNPGIDWAASPFRVQRSVADWPSPGAGLPRRAGLSSFGAGGANAHLVVEEYLPAAHQEQSSEGAAGADDGRPRLVALSARTDQALRTLAGRLAAYLHAGGPAAGTLADLAYTTQIGREALPERLALVVRSLPELADRLDEFAGGGTEELRGRATGPAWFTGAPDPADPGGSEPEEIGRRWVTGTAWDWAAWHRGEARRMVPLPWYPFDRRRCWLPQDGPDRVGATPDAAQGAGTSSVLPEASVVAPEPLGVPMRERLWTPAVRPDAVGVPGTGLVLVLAGPGSGELAAQVAAALEGERTRVVHETADGFERVDLAGVGGMLDLTDLWRPDDGQGPWQARVALLQDLIRAGHGPLRLLQVTSGLQDAPGVRPSLAGARVAGFVRMLGAEYPRIRATHLDTDRPSEADLVAEWAAADAPAEVCHRDGRRLVPGWTTIAAPAAPALQADPRRVYLVTGGTRGLGALAARHLAERGARRVVLTGLRGLPPRERWDGTALGPESAEAIRTVRELERDGVRVMLFAGRLSERSRLAAFLAEVRGDLGPIGGVVHCAGVGTRGPAAFALKSLEGVREVLEPKAEGLETLAELVAGDRPDFFVVFSSVSAALPHLAAGVSEYAAANANADFLARHWSRLGHGRFRAVQWPAWSQSGSAGPAALDACVRAGVGTLTDAQGLAVLDWAATADGPAVVLPAPGALPASRTEVPRTVPVATESEPAPVVAGPSQVPAVPGGAGRADAPAVTVEEVPGWLAEVFEEVVGIPSADLEPAASFAELGVESVMLAELVVRIEQRTGRPLEPTVLLEHPTPGELARRLAADGAVATGAQVAGARVVAAPLGDAVVGGTASGSPAVGTAPGDGGTVERPGQPQPLTAAGTGAIAVIGMACRFPGAPDVAAFWEQLTAGRDAVTEVPPGRWDTARLYRAEPVPGHSVGRWGGFLDGIEEFDPDYFGMTEQEATALDPALRLFLEGTETALRDAGYLDAELAGRPVGVFAGARMSGYRRRVGVHARSLGLGGAQNFIAAQVSHHYDLHGPAMVVDSACSSALVAVQLACRSLLAGESELAVAGAVEVLLDEEPYLEFSAARALSPSGRCRTFDERADGFVPGEGCGVLLLKRLDAAVRDGDVVHAVIDAVAVNNDGRTMGLTTPNPKAQSALVRRALAEAGLRASEIGMVEAHGTGTVIGDPIELRALTEAFRDQTDGSGGCVIGSVKSNIGHLLSAAGIAGLIKAVLAVRHGTIPPTVGCERPNPRFDLGSSPFRVTAEPVGWPDRGRRVAGVSAFGLGGTNAHAIVGEFRPEWHDRYRPVRKALPAPEFKRRRHWLDRPDAPPTGPETPPAPVPEPPAPRVVSILDLRFADDTASTARRHG
ncbi:hypothetical protein GCM10010430_61150 [Kitasatospora cystarginea]|uniref:Amino acid adenylation domain-containing protein n=1 Tax=Kitasatospora cystarginea TaxID=58350 RepID=A0ABN3ES02_9ACTN